MKKIFTGNDNRIKRRVSAVMAGVIALTTVGSVTYLKQQKVSAKETLYSIEKVISDLNSKKSEYKILEIVPDTVSANIPLKYYVSENEVWDVNVDIIQRPGFLGYYVGGSEPIRDDVDSIVNDTHIISINGLRSDSPVLINESSLRYGVVNAIYNKLRNNEDIYNERTGPFSLAEGYEEYRQGEFIPGEETTAGIVEGRIITDVELAEGLANGSLGKIERDKGYIDRARGYMEAVTVSADTAEPVLRKDAHYVLKYDVSVSDDRISEQDPANVLLQDYAAYCEKDDVSGNDIKYEEDSNFLISNGNNEDRKGQFDPYLESDIANEVNIYAIFEELDPSGENGYELSSGYRIITETPVYKDSLPADGTPLYKYNVDTGRYIYARDCDEAFRNEILSSNAVNVSETSVTSEEIDNIEAFSNNNNKAVVSTLAENADKDYNLLTEESEDDSLSIDDSDRLDSVDESIIDDAEDVLVDENQEELSDEELTDIGEEINISVSAEGAAGDTSDQYFVLTFGYFDNYQIGTDSNADRGFYGVRTFRYDNREHGAQYAISLEKSLLVPNLMNRGVISVKDAFPIDNLIYEFNKNSALCNYRWSGDEQSYNTYRITGADIYYSYGIENKEWFKRYVFDRDCYPYEVNSLDSDTASKLKLRIDRKIASEVDVSDIIGKTSAGDYSYRMIALMSGDGSYCFGEENYHQYRAKLNDISGSVYVQILYRVSDSKSKMPVIVDHTIIDNEVKNGPGYIYKDSLMYNLAYALTFDDVTGYAGRVYSMTNNIRSGELAGTAFSPAEYARDNSVRIVDTNGGDYVHENVYMYDRRTETSAFDPAGIPLNILNLSFNTEFDGAIITNGFSEVKQDIENEKQFREADYSLKDKKLSNDKVTEATVIRYIIGYGSSRVTEGKGMVTVLELEPTANFDLAVNNIDITSDYTQGSDEFKRLAIEETIIENGVEKPVYKIYEGELYYKDKDEKTRTIIKQRGLKINLRQMTTPEFVGHVEDLNATYDLIYIGMNTGYSTSNGEYKLVNTWEKWVNSATDWGASDLNDGYAWTWMGNEANGPDYSVDECHPSDGHYFVRKRYWSNGAHRVVYEEYILVGVDSYGGFRHRPADAADVTAGRALKEGDIITDFNDNNMDGLVYCNVGDMAYITETVGGLLKVWNGETDVSGNKVYTWPEYTGGERYNSKEDEKNHIESNDTHVKGYGYITAMGGITNDSTKGYSIDENGNRKQDNYSLYRTRYSGNDITNDNKNALIDFSRAGYPIILADGFYKSYDNDTRKGTINDCAVDNASYMYQAVKTINDESSDKNIFIQSYIPASIFNWYVLNLGKPTIKMTEQTCKTAQKSTVYLGEESKTGDGHYNAYFRFKIDSMGTAAAGAKYNIGLYIDINADGKYSVKSEGIAFSSLKDFESSATITPTRIDEETKMPIYELEPGHEYEAKCKLSGSFVGCLPWRLSVTQINPYNPYRRSNADGYYAIRNNDKRVRVLQIRSRGGGSSWNMKEDYNNGRNDPNGDQEGFYGLITNTAYMPFQVTGKDEGSEGPDSITVEEFEEIVPSNERNDSDAYYRYLQQNYDMVILGFVDIYRGPNMIAAAGIKKYIQNGYSVLFTHDCTSFVNSYNRTAKNPDGSDVELLGDNWGYEFNSLIRNLVGMDRYDVLGESTHPDRNEKPYKPRSGNGDNSKVVLDYESHGFTYHIINHWGYQNINNVIANVTNAWNGNPNGHNPDEYPEYLAFQQYHGNRNWNNHGLENMLPYANFVGASLGSGQYDGTNYVQQINKGQITQYPYVLDEKFDVGKTHSQYYQLDLTADDDNDGESDIVVWYTISTVDNDPAGWSRRNAGMDSSKTNMYNVSPNDVRNNYYIYNKGNVTYSGVGHSTPKDGNEMKLFVNTMIAAYRTGLHEPDLAIVDSYRENPDKVRQLYVAYDDSIRQAVVSGNTTNTSDEDKINIVNPANSSDVTEVNKNSDIDNTVDMYFNAEQVSLVQNASSIDHNLFARVFWKDDSSARTIGDYCGAEYVDDSFKDIKVTPVPLTDAVFADGSSTPLIVEEGHTDSVVGGVAINEAFMNGCVKVSNGVTYKVKVPVTNNMLWGGSDQTNYESVKNAREIYVVTRDYASYKNAKNEIYKTTLTNWAVDKVGLARVEVFDLD